MTWIKTHKRTAYIILAIIGGYLLLFLIPKCTPISQTEYSKPIPATKIDSVAKSYKQPEVKPNLIPEKKKVYKKKDTVLRKEAEKKDIILDISIVNNHINETIITPSGQIEEKQLDIPELKITEEDKEIIIVPEGVEVKEKTKAGKALQKTWKVIKKGGKYIVVGLAVVGGVAIAVVASGG